MPAESNSIATVIPAVAVVLWQEEDGAAHPVGFPRPVSAPVQSKPFVPGPNW